MDIGKFRDEVRKALAARSSLEFECVLSRAPDEYDLEIHDVVNEWSYIYSGTSWVSVLAALHAAIANGDLEDPREKFPEFYD